MEIKVTLSISQIVEEVNIQTYYLGESSKKKDPDLAIVQTSVDDMGLLLTPIETGVNEIAAMLIKRVSSFDWVIEDGRVVMDIVSYRRLPLTDAEKVGRILGKAIKDYLVTIAMVHHLTTVAPELSQPAIARIPANEASITRAISMISGNIRRRATDLGGV